MEAESCVRICHTGTSILGRASDASVGAVSGLVGTTSSSGDAGCGDVGNFPGGRKAAVVRI